MNIFRTKSIKRLLNINIIVIIIFLIVFLFMMQKQYDNYSKSINNTLNRMINAIQKEYPDASEHEILESITGKNSQGEDVLRKYGYDDNAAAITQINEQMGKNKVTNLVYIIIVTVSLLVIYLIFLWKKERKFEEINAYLKELNNHNYSLKISDNGEEELSKLRNELYKTTVLLKETAEISKKEKEQLSDSLADISHQLKTPITSIRIMLDNLEDNPDMERETRIEFIRDISKQIEWISSLVISLLKIAKFDAGAIKLNRQEINVKELINKVIDGVSILMEIKNIDVIVNVNDEATFIGDYKWQTEALTNIIKNSIEHSKENSKVYVDVENTNLFIKIKVKDEGEGIEKEDLKHIFERFYRTNKASDESIGIGLSLAKTIVEGNNGYITVQSRINEGTTFEIKYIKNTL